MDVTGRQGPKQPFGSFARNPAWAWITHRLNWNCSFAEGVDLEIHGPHDGYSGVQGTFLNPFADPLRGSWFSNQDGLGVRLQNDDIASGSSSALSWQLPNAFYALYAASNPDTRDPSFTVCFTYKALSYGRASAQTLFSMENDAGFWYRIHLGSSVNVLTVDRPLGPSYTAALPAETVTALQTRLVPFVFSFVDGGGMAIWADGRLIFLGGPHASNRILQSVRLGRNDLKEQLGPDGEYGCAFLWNGTMSNANAVRWSADPYGWTRPWNPLRPHFDFVCHRGLEVGPAVLHEGLAVC